MLLWKPLYITYDSSLSAFEGEVIPEVASFKEEGLVTPEKGKLKICWSSGGIEPLPPE